MIFLLVTWLPIFPRIFRTNNQYHSELSSAIWSKLWFPYDFYDFFKHLPSHMSIFFSRVVSDGVSRNFFVIFNGGRRVRCRETLGHPLRMGNFHFPRKSRLLTSSFSLIPHLCGAGVCAPRIWIMVYLSRHPANSTYTILFPGPQHQLRSFWNKFVLRVWSGEIDSSTFAFVLKVTETEILMTTEFYL